MTDQKPTTKTSITNDWEDVFDAEMVFLEKPNSPNKDPRLSGLCLSGGGVRSAIFCGGVLEYLTKIDRLSKFDYISTVSGGGYTGAAKSYWQKKKTLEEEKAEAQLVQPTNQLFDDEPDESELPEVSLFSTDFDSDDKSDYVRRLQEHLSYIRHLRANISYLMPTGFGGALIGTYVVLRSLILNFIIWIGLTAGAFHVLLSIDLFGRKVVPEVPVSVATDTSFSASGAFWQNAKKLLPDSDVFLVFASIGLLAVLFLMLLIPIFSIGTVIKKQSGYMWRKRVEQAGSLLFGVALICIPVGFLPVALDNISIIFNLLTSILKGENSGTAALGTVGAIVGSATAVFGLFRARLGGVFGWFSSTTIIIGALLLILSVALLSMHLAEELSRGWLLTLVVTSVVLAAACNINDVSLGRFYRDRLMEAFLPDKAVIQTAGRDERPLAYNGTRTAKQADKIRLSDLAAKKDREKKSIHLINTNLAAWWAPDSRALRRKGDNFILSPLFCGSDMTKWKKTKDVAGDRITLATAMAVSGAAVNPQGGFAGQGPTTSAPVALAMAFLSLRLGYWLRWSPMRSVKRFGNHFHPGFSQVVKRFFSREATGVSLSQWGNPSSKTPEFIELSDGGHFDNLGMYELLRRECRLIVVCDGGHDPENSYESFSVLIRRAKEDFGAEIKFDVGFSDEWGRRSFVNTGYSATKTGPQDLVARSVSDEYPKDAEYAEKGYFLASVTYHGSSRKKFSDGYRAGRKQSSSEYGKARQGLILYMKSAMIRDVDLTTKGYRGSNPLFPFDPTSNQFFSPEQFEAYRDLGQKIARQMDKDLAFKSMFDELMKGDNCEPISAKLEGLERFR